MLKLIIYLTIAPTIAATLLGGCHGFAKKPNWSHLHDVPPRVLTGFEAAFTGHWSLVALGFTSCPDICPATMADLKRLTTLMGPNEATVRLVFLSIDPKRDSPLKLQNYANFYSPLLTTMRYEEPALQKLVTLMGGGYGQDPKSGTLFHSNLWFLINPDAQWVGYYKPEDVASGKVASDLQQMLGTTPPTAATRTLQSH